MKRIAIIDTSSILHTVKHAIGKKHKLSHNEQYTFVIFGFLFRLRSIAMNSIADQLVFAYDSPVSFRRKLYYDEYKMKRHKTEKTDEQKHLDEISYPQFGIVKREIIPALGFNNIFQAKGFEADDIIARVCIDHENYEFCIVTSDEDMYQLLSNRISILKPKNYNWYNKANFEAEFKCSPTLWSDVKALAGCKTDEVPGLKGVGEVRAIQYLKNELNPNLKVYKSFVGEDAKKIIERNKKLVKLPLEGTPSFKIREDFSLSKRALGDICRKYGFKTILDDMSDFCKVLKLR